MKIKTLARNKLWEKMEINGNNFWEINENSQL